MKVLFLKLVTLLALISFLSFSFSSIDDEVIFINGKWKLTIDKSIDGNIQGNNGCDEIEFNHTKDNYFQGFYSSCPGSKIAKNSKFKGQVFLSNRGKMITMIQDNFKATQYYATWTGQLKDKGTYEGIWTDVEGNQGEFKLIRQ